MDPKASPQQLCPWRLVASGLAVTFRSLHPWGAWEVITVSITLRAGQCWLWHTVHVRHTVSIHSLTCSILLSTLATNGLNLPKDAVIVHKLNMWRTPFKLGTGNWHPVQKKGVLSTIFPPSVSWLAASYFCHYDSVSYSGRLASTCEYFWVFSPFGSFMVWDCVWHLIFSLEVGAKDNFAFFG